MSSWSEYLEQFDASFQEAKADAPKSRRWEPPDGDYQAQVTAFDWIEARNGGLYLKTIMHVYAGPHTGDEVTTLHRVDDPEKMGWLKKHLYAMGAEIEKVSDIEAVLPGLLDIIVAVTIKTGDRINEKTGLPYVGVYVNERIADPPEPLQAAMPAQDDDIPF